MKRERGRNSPPTAGASPLTQGQGSGLPCGVLGQSPKVHTHPSHNAYVSVLVIGRRPPITHRYVWAVGLSLVTHPPLPSYPPGSLHVWPCSSSVSSSCVCDVVGGMVVGGCCLLLRHPHSPGWVYPSLRGPARRPGGVGWPGASVRPLSWSPSCPVLRSARARGRRRVAVVGDPGAPAALGWCRPGGVGASTR